MWKKFQNALYYNNEGCFNVKYKKQVSQLTAPLGTDINAMCAQWVVTTILLIIQKCVYNHQQTSYTCMSCRNVWPDCFMWFVMKDFYKTQYWPEGQCVVLPCKTGMLILHWNSIKIIKQKNLFLPT